MQDDQFKQILKFFRYSWNGYRKVRKGVKKRLVRHMQRLDCRDVNQYLERLGSEVAIRNECRQLLTVSISRFFRDKALWDGLKNQILPELISEFGNTIRAMSAGCARGEEVYSLKMVWDSLNTPVRLDLTAIDLNPAYISDAQSGIYSRASLKELGPELIERYFRPARGRGRFEVISGLKSDISWRIGNLADGLPGSTYHLILLRNNVLTYLEETEKQNVLAAVLRGLTDCGWLIVGSHEKLPRHDVLLNRHPSIPWAYLKMRTT